MYLHSQSNPCFMINYEDETKSLYVSTIQNQKAMLFKGCEKIFPEHKKEVVDYMIRIIVRIAQKFNVKKLIFQDTAGKNNYDLADNYFILHGKTWYDKKMSEYLDDYNIEFHKILFDNKNIKSYNELKDKHRKVPFTRFEEITPEFRKEYFKKLGIKCLTGNDFIVTNIKYKKSYFS